MNDAFWLVWREDTLGHHSTPPNRHTSLLSAQREAERLAKLNLNTKFYVVRALFYAENRPSRALFYAENRPSYEAVIVKLAGE